jgi:hypothetical protein
MGSVKRNMHNNNNDNDIDEHRSAFRRRSGWNMVVFVERSIL